MKMVFAGPGRSGTTSISIALEHLGAHPLSQETLFINPNSHASINGFLKGKKEIDWSIFYGIDATIGWPLCFLYREQLEQFPQAKCFLNVRDPEEWFDSVSRAWESLKSVKNAKFISCLFNINETLNYVQHRFGGFPEKEKWVIAYQEYIDEVKKNVSPDRLIIYRVEEGWEPICSFLNLPVPDKDFPRENVGSVESIMKKISPLLTFDLESA